MYDNINLMDMAIPLAAIVIPDELVPLSDMAQTGLRLKNDILLAGILVIAVSVLALRFFTRKRRYTPSNAGAMTSKE